MENQNVNQEQMEQKEPQGWRDVVINPDMPLSALVQFLNVLNQRLCGLEDNVTVEVAEGNRLPITEVYRLQALAEKVQELNKQKAQEEQNKKQQGE